MKISNINNLSVSYVEESAWLHMKEEEKSINNYFITKHNIQLKN